jgi:hypothetical protein
MGSCFKVTLFECPFKNVFAFPSCWETNGKVYRTDNHFRVMDNLRGLIHQKITAEAGS